MLRKYYRKIFIKIGLICILYAGFSLLFCFKNDNIYTLNKNSVSNNYFELEPESEIILRFSTFKDGDTIPIDSISSTKKLNLLFIKTNKTENISSFEVIAYHPYIQPIYYYTEGCTISEEKINQIKEAYKLTTKFKSNTPITLKFSSIKIVLDGQVMRASVMTFFIK